jgi:hypothetical protein
VRPRRRIIPVFPCLEHGRLACRPCGRRLSRLQAEKAPRAPLTQALGPKLVRHLEALQKAQGGPKP